MEQAVKVEESTGHPCSACPWRTENHGKRGVGNGFYTQKRRRFLWSQLRRGERMTCHPTDPRMAEFEGYEKTADSEHPRECAGSLILVQREMQRINDACVEAEAEGDAIDGYKHYKKEHTRGLTVEGFLAWYGAHAYGGTIFGGMKMPKVNLNEDGISNPDLVPWEPRTREGQ